MIHVLHVTPRLTPLPTEGAHLTLGPEGQPNNEPSPQGFLVRAWRAQCSHWEVRAQATTPLPAHPPILDPVSFLFFSSGGTGWLGRLGSPQVRGGSDKTPTG